MWLLCSVHGGSLHDLLVCGVRSLGSKYGLSLSIMGFTLLSPSLSGEERGSVPVVFFSPWSASSFG